MPVAETDAPAATFPKQGHTTGYFIKNDRLYYIVEYETEKKRYLIENCDTLFLMWVDDLYLRKEVKWIKC